MRCRRQVQIWQGMSASRLRMKVRAISTVICAKILRSAAALEMGDFAGLTAFGLGGPGTSGGSVLPESGWWSKGASNGRSGDQDGQYLLKPLDERH